MRPTCGPAMPRHVIFYGCDRSSFDLLVSAQIKKQFDQGAAGSTHQPDVFTLPRDHDVAQQPMLNPCEDLDFLMSKFQHDVCSIMGVPEVKGVDVGASGAGASGAGASGVGVLASWAQLWP